MKYLFFTMIVIIEINYLAQTPFNDPNWELIKEWDFTTINEEDFLEDWYIAPCVRSLDHGSGYVEPQRYLPGNVSITSQGIVIQPKKEYTYEKVICYEPDGHLLSDGNPNLRDGFYTSGWIETKNHWIKKYGYIEAEIKVPYGYNYFPAFWTYVNDPNGINASEIDIFEMLPADDTHGAYPNNYNISKTNVHLCYENCSDPDRGKDIRFHDYRGFNRYAIEWTPSRIIWYFNGSIVRQIDNPKVNDYVKVIINLALNPFKFDADKFDDDLSKDPGYMIIKNVKFYDYRKDCENVINTCFYDFSTYDNKVKKSIIIGGSGCGNGIGPNDNYHIRASEEIIIKGDFSVPLGGEIYFDANSCY